MISRRLHGRIETLEIARGHDGLFRGAPEPVIAIAMYVADERSIRLVGRSLHRFFPRKKFPSVAPPDLHELPGSEIITEASFRYLALAIALEEDGGDDVQRAYGILEHHALITIWSLESTEVEPFSLTGVPKDRTWSAPRAVDVVFDGHAFPTSCTSDKWIGAACWTMEVRDDAPASVYRVPFLSPDRKNDWTAIVTIAH